MNNISNNRIDNAPDEICDFEVLTDLSVLNQGQPYPFTSQNSRLKAYDLLAKMAKNEHHHLVRSELQTAYPDDYKDIRLTLLNQYTTTNEAIADLQYGESPEFKADNQDELETLQTALGFDDLIACFDNDLKTYGNAIMKLRRENNIVYIDNVNPRFWFPVVNPQNSKEIIAHIIAFDYEENKKKYVKFEIHRPGTVETRIHVITNGKICGRINEEQIDSSELSEPTIIWQKLNPTDIIFSDSDFQKYASVITSMEVELSKIGYNLDQQGKIIYGPDTALELNKDGKWVLRKGKYMALHDNETAPGVITFDAQITASIEYVNKLQEQYYIASGTSAALFAMGSINAPSGTALKRLLQRPLSKASKLVQRIKPRLEKALELASIINGKPLTNISSNWKDGLVEDETETTSNYNTRITGGWMSKKAAIMKTENIDEKAAEKELAQIDAERKSETVSALDTLYPPDNKEVPPNNADNANNIGDNGNKEKTNNGNK